MVPHRVCRVVPFFLVLAISAMLWLDAWDSRIMIVRESSRGIPSPSTVRELYLLGTGGMKCCWRKNVLREALKKSDWINITDNPDQDGADWVVALNRVVREDGLESVTNAVRESLERRNGTGVPKIYLLDWSDRGMEDQFGPERFEELSRLVGRDNVYFAQRANVKGRHIVGAYEDPFVDMDWGRKKKLL